jgi:hypothetical protein
VASCIYGEDSSCSSQYPLEELMYFQERQKAMLRLPFGVRTLPLTFLQLHHNISIRPAKWFTRYKLLERRGLLL